MDKEKSIIFAQALTSEDIASNDTTVQFTTALVNPLSLLSASSHTSGIIELQLKAHASHTFGTAYGTPTAGDYVTINPAGYTMGAGDGVATIIGQGTDNVYGVTLSGTASENEVRVNLLKHIQPGTAGAWPASRFMGIQLDDNDNTEIYFKAATNDVSSGAEDVDVITVTHAEGKFGKVAETVNDALSSKSSVVEFFIGGTSGATGTSIDKKVFNRNIAEATAVTISLDS